MAASLPNFEQFTTGSAPDAAIKWRKWVEKLENMMCAMDITSDKRKKAVLLHYCGEDTYDIYDSFTDVQKGIDATRVVTPATEETPEVTESIEYVTLKRSLTDYFTPKKNSTFETYKFRQIKQEVGENMDAYYTRLRTQAGLCDFHDKDSEILSQIIQGCSSSRLRRRALRDNFDLQKIIDEARALELSESRASEMEGKSINAVSTDSTQPNRGQGRSRGSKRGRGSHSRSRGGFSRGYSGSNRGYREDSRDLNGNSKCGNCGKPATHKVCPAKGKTCRYCNKLNHFASECRSKKSREGQHVNFADNDIPIESARYHDDDSSDNDVYNDDNFIFNVSTNSSSPCVNARIFDTVVNFLVDTGSTCNIINLDVYNKLFKKPMLRQPVPNIFPYGSKVSLPCLGYFIGTINFKDKIVKSEIYVVDFTETRHSKCLLSSMTAQNLGIIHFTYASSVSKPVSSPNHSVVRKLTGEFPELFDGAMGLIKDVEVKLHIDETVQPVSQPHRRIPFHIRKDVEKELKRLEDLDVIEPVCGPTPWVSQVVVVPKKSSGVRVCIDMRQANRAILREKHPMPTIEDLMTELNESTVFSKLDLSNGYHQLVLSDSSRYITTFSTHVGLRRYKRLLFGVNAASEIFQKIISDLISGIQGARNLSDDIIIHGKTQADHDRALMQTLEKLRSSGAKLNKDKCVFSVNKITFFGHVFSSLGVSADPEKIKDIIGRSPPSNVSEIRSFLGMTQYFSRFIPRYATLTEPLRRLTHQEVPWCWSDKEEDTFNKLKSCLSSTEVMVYFDPHKPSEVLVDASPVGVSAILTQDGKVVSYASRALTDVEQRYSQTDREMLAIVYGVEHFHLYLFASDFKVVTDHKPLLGIVDSKKPASARMERWRLRLMPYQFQLVYRPGRDDLNPADYMSRHPHERPKRDNAAEAYVAYISQNAVPKSLTLDEVRASTLKCPTLQNVMSAIQSGDWWRDPSLIPYIRFRDEFSIHDGVVLRDHRLVIPPALHERVVHIAHQSHQGIVKTKQLIREKVWFPAIDKMVEDAVKSCIPCQASYPGPMKREPVCPTVLPSSPWSELAVDFAGPFPSGQYLLVVVDEHSRYPEVEIVHSTAAKVVIPRLEAIFARQGFPSVVKSDNGPPFQGHEFAEFAQTIGFKHRRITPLWPESNGTVERFMGTLNRFIRSAVSERLDWRSELHRFLMRYRATPHSSTQVSPFEALTGRKMSIGLPDVPKAEHIPISTRMCNNDAVSKQKMKEYADRRRHTAPSPITSGDQVLVRQRKLDKLTPPYNPKPYTVVEKRGSMVTAKRDDHTITRNSSHFRSVSTPAPKEEEEDVEPDPAPMQESVLEPPSSPSHSPIKHSSPGISLPVRKNPSRSAGMPKKFLDYELG